MGTGAGYRVPFFTPVGMVPVQGTLLYPCRGWWNYPTD